MNRGARFRLTRFAVAIAQRDGRNSAILIPKGAIIEVIAGPFNGTRLIDIRYDVDTVMMFPTICRTIPRSSWPRPSLGPSPLSLHSAGTVERTNVLTRESP